MSKLDRQTIVTEALALLDETGLDGISTRRLATRLGVEQPSLYWHFRDKEELLTAMADEVMSLHAAMPLPNPSDDWQTWFRDNTRSFRRSLLSHRDGARLHAGTRPRTADMGRIAQKIGFLVAVGLPEREVHMAMLAASRYTVGCVLEEQSERKSDGNECDVTNLPTIDHEMAFEMGLSLLLDGLAARWVAVR